MSKFTKKCGLLSLAVASTAGSLLAMSDSPPPPRPALINHLAFFKLIDAENSRSLIEDCEAMAASIPGIVSFYAGVHLETGRETIDSDFDVGFYVGFDSEQAYADYVAHDAHVALVAAWRPQLQWLRVHDVIDHSP